MHSIQINPEAPSTQFNRPIFGLHGVFTLSPAVRVPYLNASLSLERVIKELKTYDQIPALLEQVWSLEELYQREINYERVIEEIVNAYLLDPDKLKFFNAITIALFPKSPSGALETKFQDYVGNNPTVPVSEVDFDNNFAGSSVEKSVFGGVQYIRNSFMGRLRWDANRVDAFAIDGQHRLAALRKWYEGKNSNIQPFEAHTTIPVLFLLLDAKAGFKHPASETTSMRRIAREIFTDLNKNAKKVDEARELILDDRSLVAKCAREVVTRDTCQDSITELPLSLIRWQDANNRFDQSYFLNSLLNLRQVVELVLNQKPPKDPLERNEVERFIETLDAALGGNEKYVIDDQGVRLIDYYLEHFVSKEDGSAERPFLHLPEQFLKVALEQFRRLHKPYLIKLLTELTPYAKILAYARERSLITGLFSQYHAQPGQHQQQLNTELEKKTQNWKKYEIDVHIQQILKIKGDGPKEEDNFAFKVIFQKAIVRLARVIAFEFASQKARLGDIDAVVSYLNAIFALGRLKLSAPLVGHNFLLWTFIATHATSQKIKVTKKVEDSIYYALLLGYYSTMKYRADIAAHRTPETNMTKLLKYFRAKEASGEKPAVLWPYCGEAVEKLREVFLKSVSGWRPELAKAEKNSAQVLAHAEVRLEAVLAELCVGFEASSRSPHDMP